MLGEHVRVYKRQSDSGWKGNWGDIRFADLPVEDRHRRWADEASRIFGGLDLLALDVLVDADGNETIIELNDTAAGLMFEHEQEEGAWTPAATLKASAAQARRKKQRGAAHSARAESKHVREHTKVLRAGISACTWRSCRRRAGCARIG